MSDNDRADERLKDHARKMRPLWEELDKLDVSFDSSNDPFKLPYTSTPDLPQRDFKLTFPG